MSEKNNNTQIQKKKIHGLAIGVVLILLTFIAYMVMSMQAFFKQVFCQRNLEGLGFTVMIYADDNYTDANYNYKYPTPSKWCDLLMAETPSLEDMFRCPCDKKGRCSYAFNPTCKPDSPNDVVLLFETKAGWNQFGGQELLNFGNHKGKCHILFNNGHTRFVKPEDVNGLKWGAEQKQ